VKRFLIPIVVLFSFAYNIPKYFELTSVTTDDGEMEVRPRELRVNQVYMKYYVFW
jgi:hypothetical protein